MNKLLIVAALACLLAESVHAGGISHHGHQQTPPPAAPATYSAAAAQATVGGVGVSNDGGRSDLYVLPAPVQPGPVVAGRCSYVGSESVGVLWNLVSASHAVVLEDRTCRLQELRAQTTDPERLRAIDDALAAEAGLK